jgi:hydrogenase maturation protease
MTPTTAPVRPPRAQSAARYPVTQRSVAVEVLACGSLDRGDDRAGLVAAKAVAKVVPDDVRVRTVGQLDIDDLLAVPPGARVVIVDAATGVRGGQIVELPLTGLIGRADGLRPRSSHALAFPEVIGLADLLRGRPLSGHIVAIGGVTFGLGATMSRSVTKALPTFVSAILAAIERNRA